MKSKEIITGEALDDLYFWEELRQVAETIDRMTEQERKDYLYKLTEREMREGKSWMRNLLKKMIIDSEGRKKGIEEIRSGRIYNRFGD